MLPRFPLWRATSGATVFFRFWLLQVMAYVAPCEYLLRRGILSYKFIEFLKCPFLRVAVVVVACCHVAYDVAVLFCCDAC